MVGVHVCIKRQISNERYFIVPICQKCNDADNRARAYYNWTKLKNGTKVLRNNVKKSVSKLWAEEGFVRRRHNNPEIEQQVETHVDNEGIFDEHAERELKNCDEH